MPKKVLIIGAGGREHALLKACQQSSEVGEIVVLPGNGGMAAETTCLPIAVDDTKAITDLVDDDVDFVIIGPEVPLAIGLADLIRETGIPVYGPGKAGAQLEGSKAFAKKFMLKHNIPTADSETFKNAVEAEAYLKSRSSGKIVIKASGLAAGKGVIIAANKTEASGAIHAMLERGYFGESGETILIEDYLEGEEASITVVACGENYVVLPASQDHKRIGEADSGPNTGGMGAYAPAACVTPEIQAFIENEIIKPSLAGLVKDGIDFRGTLYIGIMLTEDGPKVLEYNVRFGDPETQVLLPLFATDPIKLLYDCATGNLDPDTVAFRNGFSLAVVLAANGYPKDYPKGEPITFDADNTENAWIIHAGTKRRKDGVMITNGGRVLSAVGYGETLQQAADHAYAIADTVTFPSKYLRKDIGYRQLERSMEPST